MFDVLASDYRIHRMNDASMRFTSFGSIQAASQTDLFVNATATYLPAGGGSDLEHFLWNHFRCRIANADTYPIYVA